MFAFRLTIALCLIGLITAPLIVGLRKGKLPVGGAEISWKKNPIRFGLSMMVACLVIALVVFGLFAR
jgi:hypothetical protein